MLFDYFFKHIPYLRLKSFYHFLGALDIMSNSFSCQFFHNKRLKQLDCHLFWQTTLIDLKFWLYTDNGTSGVVNSLS